MEGLQDDQELRLGTRFMSAFVFVQYLDGEGRIVAWEALCKFSDGVGWQVTEADRIGIPTEEVEEVIKILGFLLAPEMDTGLGLQPVVTPNPQNIEDVHVEASQRADTHLNRLHQSQVQVGDLPLQAGKALEIDPVEFEEGFLHLDQVINPRGGLLDLFPDIMEAREYYP